MALSPSSYRPDPIWPSWFGLWRWIVLVAAVATLVGSYIISRPTIGDQPREWNPLRVAGPLLSFLAVALAIVLPWAIRCTARTLDRTNIVAGLAAVALMIVGAMASSATIHAVRLTNQAATQTSSSGSQP